MTINSEEYERPNQHSFVPSFDLLLVVLREHACVLMFFI